jgi:hypothetical protein
MGRKPQGVELVTALVGSKHAKQRMSWFLQTLGKECSAGDACAALGICPSRFFDQRSQWMQAALALLEPRSPGRPSKPELTISPEEVQALRQRVRELEARAAAAEVQAELARTLPHVIGRGGPGKKTTRESRRRAARALPRVGRKSPPCRSCVVRHGWNSSGGGWRNNRSAATWWRRAVPCRPGACRRQK